MEKKDIIRGECYILADRGYNYRWITIDNGGYNKESICFYLKNEDKAYFEKEANFGFNYSNFGDGLVITEASLLEKEWLLLSIEEGVLVEKPTSLRLVTYEIY
jgi:uncharacterized protein YehS (DUF1456 family)